MNDNSHYENSQSSLERELRSTIDLVLDPTVGTSIVDLKMVSSINLSMKVADVELLSPVDPKLYPQKDELFRRITGELIKSGLANEVNITMTQMDIALEEEYASIIRKLSNQDDQDSKSQFSSTRIIAISSGKGGVGKSSVSVNLAVALSILGEKVALLDADIYGFSIHSMLGRDAEPMIIGSLVVPPRAYNVSFISTGLFARDDQPLIWRGPMLHKALEQYINQVAWLNPKFLVVDMPPGTGDVAMSVAQLIPEAEFYVVTTPQNASERVAQRSALAAKELKLSMRGVIENMSYFVGDDGKRYELFGSGGGEQLAKSLGVNLLCQIPLAMPVREGGDDGEPVVVRDPESDAAKAFFELAKAIKDIGPVRIRRSELKVSIKK